MSLAFPLMLSSVWDRLFGLDESMSLSGEQTALGWEHPLPAWAWLLIVIAALLIAHGSYARMQGARWARLGLGSFRALLLIAIAVLLAGPTAVRTDITPDPDWLLVMVDRSASMRFADTEKDGEAVRREDALKRALEEQFDVFGEKKLGKDRKILWLGYDRGAYELGGFEAVDQLNPPTVQATNLRTAIDQALQAASGRTLSGIVLFGDGQSPQPTGEQVIEKLVRQEVPVFSVLLGSGVPRLDLAIDRVDKPVSAFAGDLVPVTVTVRRQDLMPGGGDVPIDPADVRVQLINADTGEVVDERTLEEEGFNNPLRLQAKSKDSEGGKDKKPPEAMNLRVEVSYTGPTKAIKQEIALKNNTRSVTVPIVDRPIKVLYVEGPPRQQYRFMASMLTREESIDSSILLTSADKNFVQDGDSPISRFPQTEEEIRQYDVIIIGDVHPRFFSETQLTLIRQHVAVRGAGLLWIGGERHTPSLYADTELELLLPMIGVSTVGRLVPESGIDIPIKPTAQARELNLLQLSLKRDLKPGAAPPPWPDNLPPFYWAQDLGPLRPGAQVLAKTVGVNSPKTGEEVPAVVLYRYSGGEVIYVGSDETWRWRKAGGEVYFEQFWIQLIRKLTRTRLQQLDDRAKFTVSPPVVDLGASQVVELIIDDPALLRNASGSVRVQVLAVGETEGQLTEVGEIELQPAGTQGELGAEARAVYKANWRSDQPGRFVLRVSESFLAALELEANAEVRDPAEELARAATDHARLVRLAQGTGGAVIGLDELARLTKLVPNRAKEITSETRRPLTNTLFALIVLLGLLTLEWALRRALKLV